jgi:predicted nucleotidyltransferase
MNYNISSEEFQDPLLKPILQKLSDYFSTQGIRFYVIGAIARDIILNIHGEIAQRVTCDLDIAIAISDWGAYNNVEKGIVEIEGFKKDLNQKQRFFYLDVFPIDIVPFGEIRKKSDKIFWPPDESVALTVLGFEEVQKSTEKIIIDDSLTIDVASLDGIFILKLFSWTDRNIENNKDADDIAFIINNYLNINEKRAIDEHYDDIYLSDNFSNNTAGAKLLGIDVASILQNNSEAKLKIIEILEQEISKAEESRLINQILETHRSFNYMETVECLKALLGGIKIG